ncbi:MAG: cytochrome c-type biogenesis protein CcmH [SAR202 cluster bacterium]|nr:cytochrome c-type biogenesis protein CcmH [SAR202 cluster bacterium]
MHAARVRSSLRILGIVSVLLLGLLAAAPAQAQAPTLTPDQEARANALAKQLICPVCPGETLDQSQATIAKQMKAIIRERLAAGQSDRQIVDYFVSVYGESVLAQPPRSGFGLAAWLVPPVVVVAGLVTALVVLRNLRRGRAAATPPPAAESPEALRPYLDMVDDELARDGDEPRDGAPPVRK